VKTLLSVVATFAGYGLVAVMFLVYVWSTTL
jgi:hypothetical protein